MNDKEKLISLLILTDPNPYICESESGSCELTTCTECRARSTADLLIENDFLPVVRCKDCKHFRHYGKTSLFINGKNIKAGWCQRRIRYDEECRMTADDFCSYGERKEGDDK